MKSITKIALAVALVAILVLSIVVASVAWFTSNPSADVSEVTLDAAQSLAVNFDSESSGTSYRYNGQKGNKAPGDPDAPYVYQAGLFNVDLRPSQSGKKGRVKIEFGTVDMTYHPGYVSDILITDLFTITANCYAKSANGAYVKVNNVFVSYDSTQHEGMDRYSLTGYTINDDGYLMNGNNEARFDEGAYAFTFTYTFIPSASYSAWSSGSYANIVGYERDESGDYVGVVSYVPYKAKYHYGLDRYNLSNGAYVAAENGDYVKILSSYALYSSVQKYDQSGDPDEDGSYIKIAGTDEYVLFHRYNQVNGFPYSHAKYMDAVYDFMITCSVEEV